MDDNTFFIFKVCVIATYICASIILSASIKKGIRRFTNKPSGEFLYFSEAVFLEKYEKYLVFLGSSLFPLYYCFMEGVRIGNKVYDILIDKNNDNRIASWVV